MDRKQNTEILHDFIFNNIEPDESKFDYNSLKQALNEYRTGEWIDDSQSGDSEDSISNEEDEENDDSYEDDEEDIYGEWD